MTQRRKIAIAYAFAVPVLLLVVLFQDGSFFRLTARQSSMDQTASALSACDHVLLSLKDAGMQADRFIATGNDEITQRNRFMKKALALMVLIVAPTPAFAQGTVVFWNDET